MSEPSDSLVVLEKGFEFGTKVAECIQELGHFLGPIIKAPFETAAGIVNDRLRFLRWDLQQQYMQRVRKRAAARGLVAPTRRVPLNIVIPILQAASMEEDDYLQEMWARLLVNAMDAESGVEMRRAFIDILECMTSLDVRLLNLIYSSCENDAEKGINAKIIEEGLIAEGVLAASNTDPEGEVSVSGEKRVDAFSVALLNLERLGCIHDVAYLGSPGGAARIPTITPMGVALVRACAE